MFLTAWWPSKRNKVYVPYGMVAVRNVVGMALIIEILVLHMAHVLAAEGDIDEGEVAAFFDNACLAQHFHQAFQLSVLYFVGFKDSYLGDQGKL